MELTMQKKVRRPNKVAYVLSLIFLTVVMTGGAFVVGKLMGKTVAVDFSLNETATSDTWKYDFLDKDLSNYICELSAELEINSDLVVAILMVENPTFDVKATHINENGTIDCGLFQLNDRYVWTTFKDAYWFDNIELDPFNWKHNTYIAMHHIEWLTRRLKIQDEVIMAYNCGLSAVLNNTIPESTRIYVTNVNNNLVLLNKIESTNKEVMEETEL